MESTEMNAQSAKAKRRRRQAGMTMIELLAVLGVMSSLPRDCRRRQAGAGHRRSQDDSNDHRYA